MPREEGMYQRNENRQRNRTFNRPWEYHPREGGFVAVDAEGNEMFTVNFTASEMRQDFPQGKTRDEALMIMRWLLKLVNQNSKGRGAYYGQGNGNYQHRQPPRQYDNRNGQFRRTYYPA